MIRYTVTQHTNICFDVILYHVISHSMPTKVLVGTVIIVVIIAII